MTKQEAVEANQKQNDYDKLARDLANANQLVSKQQRTIDEMTYQVNSYKRAEEVNKVRVLELEALREKTRVYENQMRTIKTLASTLTEATSVLSKW